MGTNYYLKTAACECCGLHDERNTMHIGKSSGGWCFSLHVGKWLNDSDDEPEAHNLEDWQALWSRDGWVIVDEYGRPVTPKEMLRIITERGRDEPSIGFDYHRNHAQPGPNNLARHRIDGKLCVGHGEGTYDYITGEFS
jgi:hypothetical protein